MGRTPCCDHKNGLKKGPWTSEEDQKLTAYIHNHGYGNWRTLPKNAGLQRCGKSCRLRWTNYLRPDIKRGKFSFDEEEIIIQLHSILGNKWSAIAARLPGRTDNEIKNYWNTHIRKRLLRMGIDPITHSPRLDLLDLSSILNNSSTCFYDPNNIQTNISRLIGNYFQQVPQVNPELLTLATSLMSSHSQRDQSSNDNINNPNFIHQNSQQTQLCNSQVNPQLLIQSHQPHVHQESPSPSFCDIIPFPNNEAQLLSDYPNIVELSQNSQMSSDQYWQSNGMSEEVYVPNNLQSNYFVDDYRNQNFSFSTATTTTTTTTTTTSVLSTPCSSPKPLNSNSTTYFNSCSNSTTTEDERDQSYCSNFLNFEIPDHMFDVNLEFM